MSQRQRKSSYWQDAPMPRGQMVLIPRSLEEMIPEDHPVRLVDEILDSMCWKLWEQRYHGTIGQPPIHPSVMCKIWLFAMIRRIRSSRQVEYALNHSIDFMWLASGRSVDHVTLSEFRRANAEELRGIFRQLIKLAIDMGVANLAELCIDGTRVLANARKYKTWTAEKIAKLLGELDGQLASALAALEQVDGQEDELLGEENPTVKLPPHLAQIKQRRDTLAAHQQTLQEMDKSRAKRGKNPKSNPAQLPKTDPDSRVLPNKEGGYAPNYTPMIAVESQGGLIVDSSVVIGNVEHNQLCTIIETVNSEHRASVECVLADTAYATGENISALEKQALEFLSPLSEPTLEQNPALRSSLNEPVADAQLDQLPINPRTGCFSKLAFVYSQSEDCYYCPAGKPLEHRCTESHDRPIKIYSCNECLGCPLASRCRPNPQAPKGREVQHDINEPARARHRERMSRPQSKASYERRQHIGETPFAVLKTSFDLRRFLLRGHSGVTQEWLWACTGYNVKKLMAIWVELRNRQRPEVATRH